MTFRTAFTCLLAFGLSRTVAADVSFKLTDAKGAPVVDAVVSLVPLDAPAKLTPPTGAVEVAQLGKEFVPHVTAIVAGTTVKFTNRDKVQHQIYSISDPKKFEIPLHKAGTETSVLFDQPGVVAFGCNIHGSMNAYVVVLATPWFGQTAASGTIAIADVPAGRYRAEVWHGRLKQLETRTLTLPAPAPIVFSLALVPEPPGRRMPDISGGGYK